MNNIKQPQNFVLIDSHNLFHRQIRMTNPALGIDSMIGMAFHLILNSMKKEWRTFSATHAVMFLEGRSWRKDFYPAYKANRAIIFAEQTPKEQEDHKILLESFDDFVDSLIKRASEFIKMSDETFAAIESDIKNLIPVAVHVASVGSAKNMPKQDLREAAISGNFTVAPSAVEESIPSSGHRDNIRSALNTTKVRRAGKALLKR